MFKNTMMKYNVRYFSSLLDLSKIKNYNINGFKECVINLNNILVSFWHNCTTRLYSKWWSCGQWCDRAVGTGEGAGG